MCSNNPSFLANDEFYAGILHILTVVECPINLFGAFIIVARTPRKMRSVKTNLLILHFVGALVDVFLSFIATPVLTLPVCSGYPLGIALYLGIPTSVLAYIGISFIGVIGVTIVLFFEDRYHRLVSVQKSNGKRSWQRNLYAAVLYLISFTFIAPAYFNIPEENIGKTAARQINPCILDEILNRPGYFIISIDNTITCICALFMISLVFFQTSLFAILEIRFLFRKNSHKSAATIRLQKQFFKAICVQFAIPLLFITIPLVYIVAAIGLNYYNQAATNIAVAALAFHGTLSTLTMLMVHTPYRRVTLKIFGISSKLATNVDNSQHPWRTTVCVS